MKLTSDTVRQADQRARKRLAASPIAVGAIYDAARDRIVVALASGVEVAFPRQLLQGLVQATPTELSEIIVSPSGLGLHFPSLDADLYLPALLEGVFGTQRWLASQMGRKGGAVSSDAKAAAARRNGSLGGRPRKSAPSA